MGDLVAVSDYSIAQGGDDIQNALRENLGGRPIEPFDLDRITVPAGGGTNWTVPTLDGDDTAKEIRGIVVHWTDKRTYWEKSFDETGGGALPDCSSEDGLNGRGNPGGECAECPLSKFGSGKAGGQACKEFRVLFMVRELDMIPLVVTVPPTSLGVARKYFLRLASNRMAFWQVESVLSLEPAKSAAGISYAKMKFAKGRSFGEDTMEAVGKYRGVITEDLKRVRLRQDDYGVPE